MIMTFRNYADILDSSIAQIGLTRRLTEVPPTMNDKIKDFHNTIEGNMHQNSLIREERGNKLIGMQETNNLIYLHQKKIHIFH
jgi:hypothetical protein